MMYLQCTTTFNLHSQPIHESKTNLMPTYTKKGQFCLMVPHEMEGMLTLCAGPAGVGSFNFCVSRARAKEALIPGRRV